MNFQERVAQLVEEEHGRQWTLIGELLGEHPEKVRSAYRRHEGTHEPEKPNSDQGEIKDKESVKELIERAIDGNLDSGELSGINFWQTPYRNESGLMDSKLNWSAKFNLKEYVNPQEIAEDTLEDIKNYAPEYSGIEHSRSESGWMYEIDIFDLHFGKYVRENESGGYDYDMDVAERVFFEALEDLLGWVYEFDLDYILLPLGQDLFNTDGIFHTTTKGTPQESTHGTHREHFRRLREMLCRAIDKALVVAPVKVPIVPGNHDKQSAFYMGEVLDAWYYKTEHVEIDNSPKLRKYHLYGNNLIGFAHGDDEKDRDLPAIMANEAADLWGKSQIREWHLGHTHRKKSSKYMPILARDGVTIRRISSLTSHDNWHYSMGYTTNDFQAESFLWHKENGLKANYTYNLL